ncbi:FliH/SctL family protein [Bacillus bombysepticus]|uniref:FliH/SctL family protein n=1 Tax=Bacillus bombysepticus TaxID=658666 RepID=UPI003018122E
MSSLHDSRVISKKYVEVSKESVSINDKVEGPSTFVAKTIVQEHVQKSLERIKSKEEEILAELESKREAAIQEGYKQGQEMAVDEAYQKLKRENEETDLKYKLLYEQLEQEKKEWEENKRINLERFQQDQRLETCRLAVQIADKIACQSIEVSDEVLVTYFEEVMKSVEEASKQVFVRIHPLTYGRLKEKGYNLFHENMQFVSDPLLKKADLIIETDRTCMDYSVSSRLKQIEKWIHRVINDVD